MLVVAQTHPVQYHAPVFRALQQKEGIPVTAIYGSDFSVAGYRDREFGASFAWDTDLLSGYTSVFLSRVADGGATHFDEVRARGLGRALDAARPGAVLVAGYSPRFHRSAFFEAWRRRLPVLFRAEVTSTEPSGRAKRTARRLALRALYSRCAGILYIGEDARRHYLAAGCEASKMIRSPYCVDTTPFRTDEASRLATRDDLRGRLGFEANRLVMVFAGKLTPKKRPDLLLEAARDLGTRIGRPVGVIVVGEGELRPALEAAAAGMPHVRVHFAGFRNQHDLSAWYHAGDLLVLPSQHSETWGLVVNEALAHGLPCVVSSAVGCGEDLVLAGRTGEIFAVGSAASLVDAIVRVQPLVGRGEARAACRARVAEYSVDEAAAGIAQAYRRVAG